MEEEEEEEVVVVSSPPVVVEKKTNPWVIAAGVLGVVGVGLLAYNLGSGKKKKKKPQEQQRLEEGRPPAGLPFAPREPVAQRVPIEDRPTRSFELHPSR